VAKFLRACFAAGIAMGTPSDTVEAPVPRLSLLVLQPTPFCNIDCSYCYLLNRNSRARMSVETLELACQRVFESPYLGPRLQVAWHGGEPLVVPLAWYEEAVALMDRRRPAEVRLQHCFQTNGLLANEDWARFFARIGARVGLSIDGPADVHDANRRTRRGHGTHDAAMRAVRLLQDQGHEFHVITVLTEGALDHPERLFDFYVQTGIKEVGFNIEEIEGLHAHSSLVGPGIETRFRSFMARFFELVCDAPCLRVREFEDAIGMLLSKEPVMDQQNVPFAIVSIGHDGTVSTFSPELLGSHHPRFNGFGFGHVATHRLSDIKRARMFRTISSEIQRGVNECERSCRYFRWCGGGVPGNKLFETGRFDATETMQCRLTRQVILDTVIAGIEARTRQRTLEQEKIRPASLDEGIVIRGSP
jgi:uncharacterized protein